MKIRNFMALVCGAFTGIWALQPKTVPQSDDAELRSAANKGISSFAAPGGMGWLLADALLAYNSGAPFNSGKISASGVGGAIKIAVAKTQKTYHHLPQCLRIAAVSLTADASKQPDGGMIEVIWDHGSGKYTLNSTYAHQPTAWDGALAELTDKTNPDNKDNPDPVGALRKSGRPSIIYASVTHCHGRPPA